MNPVRSYRDLQVWQKAMDLVLRCYRAAKELPKEEKFGLVPQIQRAAVSVPANIAEGHGRGKTGEYLHFLGIAQGSLTELETLFLITERLGYLHRPLVTGIMEQTGEIGRMLHGLIRSLRQASGPQA